VATVVAAAEPFTSDASLSAKLATAAINLVLGGACGCSWLGPRTVHSGYSLHRPEGGRVPRIAGPLRPVEPSDVSEPMAIRPTPGLFGISMLSRERLPGPRRTSERLGSSAGESSGSTGCNCSRRSASGTSRPTSDTSSPCITLGTSAVRLVPRRALIRR
jgi:hypothetical protein